MNKYLLIHSRDPFTATDMRNDVALAGRLKKGGHQVALFLTQNAVLPVRSGARRPELHDAIGLDVEVLADDFSLRERGIGGAEMAMGVRPAPISLVVDRLATGWITIWH